LVVSKAASAATYIWQPLAVSGYLILLPEFKAAWKVDLSTGVASSITESRKTIAASDQQNNLFRQLATGYTGSKKF
jgi:hypothetical protein